MSVTVCIPSIPTRPYELRRALMSVALQTHPVDAVAIAFDYDHRGAAATRNRTIDMAATEWIAFLDDDDVFMPHHIERCLELADYFKADAVVPWFEVIGGVDPFIKENNRWEQVDAGALHSFGITCLIRRAAIGDLRFVVDEAFLAKKKDHPDSGEDYTFWLQLAERGAKFVTTPEITWRWHHWGVGRPGTPGNTSGRPDRW